MKKEIKELKTLIKNSQKSLEDKKNELVATIIQSKTDSSSDSSDNEVCKSALKTFWNMKIGHYLVN